MSELPPEPDSEPPTETDLVEGLENLSLSPVPGLSPAPRFVRESRQSATRHFPDLSIRDSSERPSATIFHNFAVNGAEAVILLHRFFTELYPVDSSGLHPDIRFYVVWTTPEQREGEGRLAITGLHFGVGNRAYRGILDINRGVFSTLAFRRVPDLIEGRRTFLAEAERFEIDSSFGNRFFIWK